MKKSLFLLSFFAFLLSLAAQEIKMEILQNGIICERLATGSPINPAGLVKASNGDLITVVQDSTDLIPPSRCYVSRSSDGGKTWVTDQKPFIENRTSTDAVGTVLWQLPDGNILIAAIWGYYSRPLTGMGDLMKKDNDLKILYGMVELYISCDDLKTMTKIKDLTKPNEYLIPAVNGTLLELSNGDLLLPGYLAPLPGKPRPGAGFWRSTDGGKTWGEYEEAFRHLPGKNFNEATYIQKDDGTIVGFARWDTPWYSNADNGESQLVEELYKTVSTDNGKTWSEPEPTDMLMIYPVSTRLKNGVYVLFGGKRDDGTRDRTCHVWASMDGENYTDLGQVYYFKPEHRNGLMDSQWGTTGGQQAILPYSDDSILIAFNGGSPHDKEPYYTYTDYNIIRLTPVNTEKITPRNPAHDPASYRITGGKVETAIHNGEEVLKVTGPAVLESLVKIPVDPENQVVQFSGEILSGSGKTGINHFGARCYTDNGNLTDNIFWTVEESKTKLIEPCRAEDCFIKVEDASKWWRSSYFRVNIGGNITGRDLGIVRKKEGYYLVQLQRPCGFSLPAGTPVHLQANGTADVIFGGILRGMNFWRTIDGKTTAGSHGLSPRHLRKNTKFIRMLIKINQEGDKDTVLYIKNPAINIKKPSE